MILESKKSIDARGGMIFIGLGLIYNKIQIQEYYAILRVWPHVYNENLYTNPDNNDHGDNTGPIWVLSAPDWPHVRRVFLVNRGPAWHQKHGFGQKCPVQHAWITISIIKHHLNNSEIIFYSLLTFYEL